MTSLTTPYGSTTFAYCDSALNAAICPDITRRITITDPANESEIIEFRHAAPVASVATGLDAPAQAPGESASVINNNAFLENRNTFIWNKEAVKKPKAAGESFNPPSSSAYPNAYLVTLVAPQ